MKMKPHIFKVFIQQSFMLLSFLSLLIIYRDFALAAEDAQLFWPNDVPISTAPYDQGVIDIPIVPVGNSGAIITWKDSASGNIFAQQITRSGQTLWQTNGIAIAAGPWYQFAPHAVSDGAGGAIITWVDGRDGWCSSSFQAECDIFAQRINSSGEKLWGDTGVPISTAERNQGVGGISISTDGVGGAIIVWEDARPPNCCRIYAQRVDANGAVKWTADGIPISPPVTYSVGPIGGPPQIVSDGEGGAIISWFDVQKDPTLLAVKRIDANGQTIWTSGGFRAGWFRFAMAHDGIGGVILAWDAPGEQGQGANIFVQRIDHSGKILWQTGGVRITNAPQYQWFPDVVSDGNGGAIIVWGDERNPNPEGFGGCNLAAGNCDIYAQRVDYTGQVMWLDGGIPISTAQGNQFLPQIVGDGVRGAFVAWQDCRAVYGDPPCMSNLQCPCIFGMDIYAQHINATGQALWQIEGSPVSVADGNQGVASGTPFNPSIFIVSDGRGGAILAWPDGRNNGCAMLAGFPSDCDLYVQGIKDERLSLQKANPWLPLLLLDY